MGVDVISPDDIIKKKGEQITEYYFLHKIIKYIFESKYNQKYENELYIIDINWINHWKNYSNYLNAQKNFDEAEIYDKKALIKSVEEMCQNMINTGEINFNGVIPPPMNNEIEENFFCNKLIYNLEDFNCLINENNYRSFQELSKSNIISKNVINLFINQEFLFLIFKTKLKIKCFCKMRSNFIQITIDFNSSTLENQEELNEIFKNFIKFRIKKKNDKDFKESWNSFFEEHNIDVKGKKGKVPIEDEYGHYILRNDCIFLKYLSLDDKIINNINFNNINYGRLIGFETIDIINYMNATLQCLINTDILTEYLLNKNIFMNINKNKDKCELSSIYSDLLVNVFCIQNINTYNPINFKELLIAKEYSFNKFGARDSKDLINFILEEMNCELSRLENKKIDGKIMDEILSINQNDEKIMLNYFLYQFKYRNSIISQIFCSINKSQTQCLTCLDTIYNYESCFIFDFILSLVEGYCQKNNIYIYENNGIISIPLYLCFKFYFSIQYFSVYSYCKKCSKDTYKNQKIQIISLSPTIIISLNSNGDNQYRYKIDFPEILDLKEFVTRSYGDSRYQLKAVIAKSNKEKYIAFCRKQIDNKWYCYNDTSVTCCSDQKNDFKNGITYILFYESISNKYNNIFFDKYIYETINNMNNFNNNNQFNFINNKFNVNNFNNNSNNFMLNNNQMNNFNNNNIFNQMNNMRRINNNNNVCNPMNNMGQMNNLNINNIRNQMNNNNNVCNPMNNMGQMNNLNNNNIYNPINNMGQMNNFNNYICNQIDNMGQMNNNDDFMINKMNNFNNNTFLNNKTNNFNQMNNIFINNQVTNRISQFNIFNNTNNINDINDINDINNNCNFRTQINFNNSYNNRQKNINLNKKNNINNNALNRSFNCNNVDSMNQMFNINTYNPYQNNNNPNYNNNQINQNNYSSNTYNQRNQNNNYSNKIRVMDEMKNKMKKKY